MRLGLSPVALVLLAVGCGGAAGVEPPALRVPTPAAVVAAGPAQEMSHVPARNAFDAPGAFVIVEEESRRLILADEVKEELLASSPIETTSAGSQEHVLEAKVKLSELPPEQRLEGRSFVLYRGAEKKCVVRGGPVRAVAYTYDPISEEPSEEAAAATEKPSAEEVARGLWAMSNVYLASKVALGPDCKGATWGRLEELPEPRFAAMRPPEDAAASRAVTVFQSRSNWLEAQRSYVDGFGGGAAAKSGTWEDQGSVTFSEIVAPFAGGTYLLRQAVWDEGCGANAGLALVWRGAPDGAPAYEADDRFAIEVVMDLDGDGTLEMFGTEGDGPSMRPFFGTEQEPGRKGSVLTHSVAIHGCRC